MFVALWQLSLAVHRDPRQPIMVRRPAQASGARWPLFTPYVVEYSTPSEVFRTADFITAEDSLYGGGLDVDWHPNSLKPHIAIGIGPKIQNEADPATRTPDAQISKIITCDSLGVMQKPAPSLPPPPIEGTTCDLTPIHKPSLQPHMAYSPS